LLFNWWVKRHIRAKIEAARLRPSVSQEDEDPAVVPIKANPSIRFGKKRREAKQCAKLSKIDAAYMAGLIDGEGCIGAYWCLGRNRGQGGVHLVVAFCMTDREVLDWVAHVTKLGTIHAIRTQRKPNHSQSFRWQCNGVGASSLLDQTFRYLRIASKVEQAERLIMLQMLRQLGKKLTKDDLRSDDERAGAFDHFHSVAIPAEWRINQMQPKSKPDNSL
jgi:hypothetical protein